MHPLPHNLHPRRAPSPRGQLPPTRSNLRTATPDTAGPPWYTRWATLTTNRAPEAGHRNTLGIPHPRTFHKPLRQHHDPLQHLQWGQPPPGEVLQLSPWGYPHNNGTRHYPAFCRALLQQHRFVPHLSGRNRNTPPWYTRWAGPEPTKATWYGHHHTTRHTHVTHPHPHQYTRYLTSPPRTSGTLGPSPNGQFWEYHLLLQSPRRSGSDTDSAPSRTEGDDAHQDDTDRNAAPHRPYSTSCHISPTSSPNTSWWTNWRHSEDNPSAGHQPRHLPTHTHHPTNHRAS